MKKRAKAARARAIDHCRWKYRGKGMARACREGADAAVDEMRHEVRSLGQGGIRGMPTVDIMPFISAAKVCEMEYASRGAQSICKRGVALARKAFTDAGYSLGGRRRR